MHATETKTYLSAAETAKLVRVALKREFPGVKFSVRSDTYAGGASIRVRWMDGPTSDAVQRVAGAYAGADFDGMVGPNARLVRFGADYVFCNRDVSDEWTEEIVSEFESIIGRPITRERRDWWQTLIPVSVDRLNGTIYHMVESETESVDSLVLRYTGTRTR